MAHRDMTEAEIREVFATLRLPESAPLPLPSLPSEAPFRLVVSGESLPLQAPPQ
jgi:hypothetical protein